MFEQTADFRGKFRYANKTQRLEGEETTKNNLRKLDTNFQPTGLHFENNPKFSTGVGSAKIYCSQIDFLPNKAKTKKIQSLNFNSSSKN